MPKIEDIELNKNIDERIKKLVPFSFTDRKLTDIPTDALQVTSRKFVTLNGTTANRPRGSILGQFYFDTTLGQPIWWDGTSFVDASGNVI